MVAAVTAMALVTSGAGVAAASAPSRVTLIGTGGSPGEGYTDKGPTATSTTVSDNIYLSVRDPGALAAEAKSVSSPGTAGYGRYLTSGQVRAANQLSPAQVAQVRSWLTAAGLTVSQPNWRELSVTGTVGQLANAFDVTFHDYYPDPAVPGYPDYYIIPATDMSVPGDIGNLILAVGTSTFTRVLPSQYSALAKKDGPAAATRAADAAESSVNLPARFGGITDPITDPITDRHADAGQASSTAAKCSRYWGQFKATGVPRVNGAAPPDAVCGYTPAQLRHAYGLDSSKMTGKGQTVAVVSPAMDTLERDVNTWSKNVGTQGLRRGQLTVVPSPDGSAPEDPSDYFPYMIENTLDVEAVHGMAPDADIDSVGISTDEGAMLLDSFAYILDRTRASIVSVSLAGLVTPGQAKAYEQVYQEGALQGVGFYFASSDAGVLLNPLPGSWATAVGGTSLAIGANGAREWETGWGDEANSLSADGTSWKQPARPAGGAGGGWLTGEPQPWYQHGVVPADLKTGPDGKIDRIGPDISMDADATTGYLVGGTPLDGTPTTNPSTWRYIQADIGGTSLSTPLFAGVQALAQQADGGKRLGFANPELYQRAGTPAIRDVTTLPHGARPVAVAYGEIGIPAPPTLYTMLGRVVAPPAPDQTPTSTGPGFDTETGLGTPTGDYLRSFGHI